MATNQVGGIMGLKLETGYTASDLNVTVSTAYAKINTIIADKDGNVKAAFTIQQTREDCDNVGVAPLEVKEFNFLADKTLPIWKQAYEVAKSNYFTEWLDDVPEDEVISEEVIEEVVEEPII